MISQAYTAPRPAQAVSASDPAMPRAALINTYSTRNLGDAAIMRATAALVPGGTAHACLDKSHELRVPGVRLTSAPSTNAPLRVSVGGDIFNNSRPYFVTRNFLSKVADLGRAPSSTIAFGQTIPASCTGIAYALLTRILKMLPAVVVRDQQSWTALRASGVAAELSWDAAFITEPTVHAIWRAHALLDAAEMRPERAVLISVRPFDAMYPANQAAFESSLAELARSLIARGHEVALLIQSDVAAWDEDRTAARRIAATDSRIRVIDCLAGREDPDPVATLTALLSIANIAVGVRYHTSILRLAGGRVPFNLYYSRKGQDLQQRLSLPGCHVSQLSSSDMIADIEATANMPFDPAPLRRDVREHFAAALEAVSA